MRCLFITQEYAPLFTEGGLGLTSRALPAAMQRRGIPHDVVLPYYPWLLDRAGCRTEAVCSLGEVVVAGRSAHAEVRRLLDHGGPCDVYLIRSDSWYDRGGIYRDARYQEFGDARERAAFFGICVNRWLARQGPSYDLVHGNDWQSGPALAHLRADRGDRGPALLMQVHSAVHQGPLPGDLSGLGLPEDASAELRRVAPDEPSLLLLGLLAADRAVTCSPTYARELAAAYAASPLGSALAGCALTGIVAGIDQDLWNPAAVGVATSPYSAADVTAGKLRNRRLLRDRLGLADREGPALVGICGRLVREKGIDLIAEALDPLLRARRIQLVLIGPAEDSIREDLRALHDRHPDDVRHLPAFDQETAWLLYAASDFALMPSREEPCGLNQLIAMRYGTLPLVTPVGGLADTVEDIERRPHEGTGWFIPKCTAQAVAETVEQALERLRGEPGAVLEARRRAMARDWSWAESTTGFVGLYARLVAG
ncbi:glycogen/starch synthase [Streptomyces griseus]|uniref:Glycogen synthase n=1 Tax=Streptomyces sp. CMC78 TaxID=3231512 RepID=A0AB33KFJ7_9ACTN|nr:glycogen/starch synthase [Streptomyces sp. ID01-9D]MDX5572199.1 glycogen/starch synthase [Streptomyces sp. ID01-9D]WSV24795.1 glycogen/starch synthase [Streptomyces fimicarius]WTC86275.1 glycogen/starch synthase [Streptomyces griseus]WTD71107.1 glycogen/starch synthase [Streptomyces griseus]